MLLGDLFAGRDFSVAKSFFTKTQNRSVFDHSVLEMIPRKFYAILMGNIDFSKKMCYSKIFVAGRDFSVAKCFVFSEKHRIAPFLVIQY